MFSLKGPISASAQSIAPTRWQDALSSIILQVPKSLCSTIGGDKITVIESVDFLIIGWKRSGREMSRRSSPISNL